ncbi:hypothetical protein DQ237_03000 [Blastococcus sp. TF02-8]|uniref:hypothetical protein n=1 Tax=Blastococcus sp. TF02-8 TaxID=2250574 RepID=UPI000DE9D9CC|nr:hypothetical protein [Blastococcus sp. TF02-8]RBY97884.1 hypothetical protein DQ237_03000 [Blastococcus sp. TF02-8]
MVLAHRLPAVLVAGLAGVTLLSGCGGDDGSDGAAASSSAAPASETEAPDLASGLLPAEAFGPGATVVAVSPEQLAQGAGLAAGTEDADIQPESCRAAVEGTQPDLEDFDDVAAVSATSGGTATVEMLIRGGPLEDAVEQLGQAAERCPQAQVTLPELGQASISFETLPVDELGDGSALVRYTTVVTGPDGMQVSVPTVIGAVEDGDRLLVLLTIVADPTQAGAGIDQTAFADLLRKAFDTQADALG